MESNKGTIALIEHSRVRELTKDPEFSFFEPAPYKQHSAFSVTQTLTDFKQGLDYSKKVRCELESIGDLLTRGYLDIHARKSTEVVGVETFHRYGVFYYPESYKNDFPGYDDSDWTVREYDPNAGDPDLPTLVTTLGDKTALLVPEGNHDLQRGTLEVPPGRQIAIVGGGKGATLTGLSPSAIIRVRQDSKVRLYNMRLAVESSTPDDANASSFILLDMPDQGAAVLSMAFSEVTIDESVALLSLTGSGVPMTSSVDLLKVRFDFDTRDQLGESDCTRVNLRKCDFNIYSCD